MEFLGGYGNSGIDPRVNRMGQPRSQCFASVPVKQPEETDQAGRHLDQIDELASDTSLSLEDVQEFHWKTFD